MKKIFMLAAAAVMMMGCSLPAKLMNSSTHQKANVAPVVAAVFADLEVSPTKITYFMMPSTTVANAGYDNVINTAVREALLANGDADVLVALETQVKYDKEGKIESVTVTGYPAKYTNFRNAGDDYLKEMQISGDNQSAGASPLGKFKFGK